MRWLALLAAAALAGLAAPARAGPPPEVPMLAPLVADGRLPPVAQRLPKVPFVVDTHAAGRSDGTYGGTIRTLSGSARDLRYIGVAGYARLVGYDQDLNLRPDILQAVDDQGDRVFTFTLRQGHRWSDGQPFTTEDFRYYWEDIANNAELSPSGPPDFFLVNGKPPKVEVLDATHIRYSWDQPNPAFLPALALPRPVFIYSPAHYLKQFHIRYNDPDRLAAEAARRHMRSWAAMHNKLDAPYEQSNPDLPVLDPYLVRTEAPANRFVFERNPYFHRVDAQGRQLPYIDRLIVSVTSPNLFAARANAGDVDLLSRGLSLTDVPVLKEGEGLKGYRTLLWPVAQGSAFALYPNLTTRDPVWRAVLRDVRFRRALSLAIDRHTLNNALWFGLGTEGNDTVMPRSPLYSEDLRTTWATYDPDLANRLLDEMGLTRRDGSGTRLLPDGRPAMIVVEVGNSSGTLVDALQITTEFWADIGIKLFIKAEDPSNLRQRSYGGQTIMVAGTGLDNAIPTPLMAPDGLAPVQQNNAAWPRWGQYFETGGRLGEAPDMPEARRLMELYRTWHSTDDAEVKAGAWREMLKLHAEQQWVIGTVSGDIQPIVAAGTLRNLPDKGVFAWEPTAMLGAYRPDAFYFGAAPQEQAAAR